jgi:hypothetical protein
VPWVAGWRWKQRAGGDVRVILRHPGGLRWGGGVERLHLSLYRSMLTGWVAPFGAPRASVTTPRDFATDSLHFVTDHFAVVADSLRFVTDGFHLVTFSLHFVTLSLQLVTS